MAAAGAPGAEARAAARVAHLPARGRPRAGREHGTRAVGGSRQFRGGRRPRPRGGGVRRPVLRCHRCFRAAARRCRHDPRRDWPGPHQARRDQAGEGGGERRAQRRDRHHRDRPDSADRLRRAALTSAARPEPPGAPRGPLSWPDPMANPFLKQYLMTAGPTPIPPAVSEAMAQPVLYHRAPAFVEVYARCLDRLKDVFQTENDVLVFAASGSGAMESAVANLVRPGEPALVASCGKFGERWAELSEAFGAEAVHHQAGWGNRVEPADLEPALGAN